MRTRTLILTLMILLGIISPAMALNVPFENIGQAYNDGYWYPATSTYINNANKDGYAYGFNVPELSQPTNQFTFYLYGYGESQGFSNITVKLWKGSEFYRTSQIKIPSRELLSIYEPIRVDYTNSLGQYSIAGNIDQPGEYWLSFQGGTQYAGGAQFNRMEISSPNLNLATVHNPEPATMFLMGGGLLALLRKRKAV